MADPIKQLQGVPEDKPIVLPEPVVMRGGTPMPPGAAAEPTDFLMPEVPPLPNPPPPNVAPPLPAAVPGVAPAPVLDPAAPPPLNVSTITPTSPLELPTARVYGSDGVAPVAVSGKQQALNVLAPIAAKDVANLRQESASATAFALSPNALPPTSQWEPPDLEGSISNYGANMAVLRQSFAAQTAARNNQNEKDWLERNMKAIENMNNPKSSPTANAFGWVGEMLGTSEDGSRSYVGAATFDKSSGQWKGSPVGTILYGLGLLQNSTMGAIIDTKNMLRNVDRGLKSVYENFTPPWLRGQIAPALNAFGKVLGYVSPAVAMYQAATSGNNPSGPLTYNDGKSNFLEALRGAQFSFSDKASKGGLGIDYNKGFKDVLPGGKTFDVNPGLLGGLALDVLLGGKVDKIAGMALVKMGYKSGAQIAAAKAARAGSEILAEVPTAAPKSVFKQLDIPFSSGPVPTNKAPKVSAPVAPKIPKNTGVQQVLPIEQMMKEFGEADKLTNPLAYKKGLGGDGQLSLRLGKIDTVPVVRNAITPTARAKNAGKQLKLDFTDLPEAVAPQNIKAAKPVTELLNLADDVPLADIPPAARGEVLNAMQGKIKAKLNDNQIRMSVEPDIGRRPILSSESVPIKPYVASEKWQALDTIDLPTEPLIHGTRVENLVLSTADPAAGSALNELGAGHYFSTSRDVAEMATKAAAGEGLPSVAGRNFMREGEGAIHSVQIKPDARILDGNAQSWTIETIFNDVAKNFPGLKDRAVTTTPRSYVQLIDDMVAQETSGAARLQFQHEVSKALRAEGIDGVRGADNVAIFNPDVITTTNVEKVTHLGMHPDDAYTARSQLDDWGFDQNSSNLAIANALDAETVALNQKLNQVEEAKRAASKETWQNIEYAGLMDHPKRQPTLDEYSRLVVDDLYTPRYTGGYVAEVPMSLEIGDKIKEAISRRGIKLESKQLDMGVGGHADIRAKEIVVNSLTTKGDLTAASNLNVLLHEMFHFDIDKVVGYFGKGVTNNESIVESASNAILSILETANATGRKNRFDGFFDFINDAERMYARDFKGLPVELWEVKKQYGELIVKMVKETIEEIAPKGFKTPTIDKLRIFGPDAFESFATSHYGSKTSIEKAFEGSITTINEGLSIASKVDVLATNPMTGKLNTKVRDFLVDSFGVDLLADQVHPLVKRWADSIARAGAADPKKTAKAKALLDLMESGSITTDDAVAQLTKLDKGGSKQYVPAINKGVEDAKVRKYCG